jgi:hypothetical protein
MLDPLGTAIAGVVGWWARPRAVMRWRVVRAGREGGSQRCCCLGRSLLPESHTRCRWCGRPCPYPSSSVRPRRIVGRFSRDRCHHQSRIPMEIIVCVDRGHSLLEGCRRHGGHRVDNPSIRDGGAGQISGVVSVRPEIRQLKSPAVISWRPIDGPLRRAQYRYPVAER